MKKITVKQIRSFLSTCKFNPNEPGPLKIILETNNPNYYEMRAIEFIREARASFNLKDYEEKIQKAIQLLILANLVQKRDDNGTF